MVVGYAILALIGGVGRWFFTIASDAVAIAFTFPAFLAWRTWHLGRQTVVAEQMAVAS